MISKTKINKNISKLPIMHSLLLFFSLALSSLRLTAAAADPIPDISFSNLQFSVLDGSLAYPQNVWKANLDFTIPNPSTIKTDDYFRLYMPKVYQVYYSYPDHYFNISMNGNAVFQCYPEQQAGSSNTATIMSCSSYIDFTQKAELFGSLEFAFTFNCGAGDILSSSEIANANYFQSGVSTVFEFFDDNNNSFDTQVTFDAMSIPDDLMNVVRNPTDDTLEIYYAAPTCASNGKITSGTVQYFMQAGTTFDQLHSNGGVSDESTHNEFYMLNATQNGMISSKKMSVENGQNVAKFGISSVKSDEMIWFNLIQTVGSKTSAVSNTYQATYTCASGSSTWSEVHNTLTVIDFKFASNHGSISYAVPTVTTTQTSTWGSPYTTTTTEPIVTENVATVSVTVDVDVPQPTTVTKTTTFTHYWDSSFSTTITKAIDTTPVDNKVIVTIDVELPTPVVTYVSTFNNVQSTISVSTTKKTETETETETEVNTKTRLETQTQTLTVVSTSSELMTTTATTVVEIPTTVTTSEVQTKVVNSLVRETATVTTENTVVSTVTFPVVTERVTTGVTNFTTEYYTNFVTVPLVSVTTFVDTQISTVTTDHTTSVTSLSTATASSMVTTSLVSSYISTLTNNHTLTSLITSAVLNNVTLTDTATTNMLSRDTITKTQNNTFTTWISPVTVVESCTFETSTKGTQETISTPIAVLMSTTSSTILSTSSFSGGDNQQNYKFKTASFESLTSASSDALPAPSTESNKDFSTSISTEIDTTTQLSTSSLTFDDASSTTTETLGNTIDVPTSTAELPANILEVSTSTVETPISMSTFSKIASHSSPIASSLVPKSAYTASFIQFENRAESNQTPLAFLFSVLFSIIAL